MDFVDSFSEICKNCRFLLDDFLRYVKSGRGNGAKSGIKWKAGDGHY